MLRTLRRGYWSRARQFQSWCNALGGADPSFRKVVLQDHLGRRRAVKPIAGETARRAALAVRWLLRAQDATTDDGVSYGYFPVDGAGGWQPSYPETTGYIMTSLLAYARAANQPELVERVARMAHWEAAVQMPSGAVQGGKLTAAERQQPAAFNTGMVLDGLVSLLECRSDAAIAAAAGRAAGFLVADLNEAGLFTTNGPFVSPDSIKLYNVLCAWALHRYGVLSGEPSHRAAALRAAEGALRFQADNGWFAENCLTNAAQPLTHTIGYTLQGLLEVAAAAGREDILDAVERGFTPLLAAIEANGYLAGRFDSDWRPAVSWSCLTGSSQLAIVGYRLAALGRGERYAAAADLLLGFLKAVQRQGTGNADIDGALAGSYPVFGGYMTGGYPNWATKYLLDALMLEADRSGIDLGTASSCLREPA
ncbi:MAG: hypothetical protein ACFCUT_13020 [Kiloniellaceae bacterium]